MQTTNWGKFYLQTWMCSAKFW